MIPTTCQNFTAPYYSGVEQFLYGYALPGLCLLGTFVNIVNIVVLADRRLAAPTYIYLIYLAIADLLTLLLYFLDLISRMHFPSQLWAHIYTAYIYLPLGSISTCSSLLLTVAVTIDRYVFIQNPAANTSQAVPVSIQMAAPRNRARKIGAVVCLAAAVVNSPRMAAWYVDYDTGCRRSRPWAADQSGWFSIYSYLRLLFLNIGSILVLAAFNFLLIVLVQRSTKRRESRQTYYGSANRRKKNKKKVKGSEDIENDFQMPKCIATKAFSKTNVSLTVTLIAATLLALSGEIPSTLFSRVSANVIWKGDKDILDKEPYRYFVLAAYILILIEYSGNFVIYCLLNKRFRLVLRSKFCPGKAAGKQHHHKHHVTIFSGDRRKRSASFDCPKSLHSTKNARNGSVSQNHNSNSNNENDVQISQGEYTDNLVTRGGDGSPGRYTNGDRENLSEFWRSAGDNDSVKGTDSAIKASKSFPNILIRESKNECVFDKNEAVHLTPSQ